MAPEIIASGAIISVPPSACSVHGATSTEVDQNPLIPAFDASISAEELAGPQCLKRARDTAIRWWSILEVLRESDGFVEGRKGSLPQWAREVIGTWRQQHDAHEVYREWMDVAKEALKTSSGEAASHVYEVWTSRQRMRLDGQFDFWADANRALIQLQGRFPEAFIARVHRRQIIVHQDAPELLDTLIGDTYWCGTSDGDGDGEDHHTVQDATGRCVTVPASVLLGHPAYERMSAAGRERVAAFRQRPASAHEASHG